MSMLRKYRTKIHAARKAQLEKRKGIRKVVVKVRTEAEQKALEEKLAAEKPKVGRPKKAEVKEPVPDAAA